ncbi:hypothetical protein VT84_16480 [Gemmata sp. SH-PL17]|uniref:hypothetical protein n=1 Tax=Gemmata sp. SH-PL17 TaxID=1630693 RepID=UPI00078DC7FD|nr:hypothetical protein [Gemmata sp. SH-PL17]AMV25997.1 hypothetical protein VT84_16480 [Gemmata sp. SH-PL17]
MDKYPSMAERRIDLVQLFTRRDALTIPEIEVELNTHRFAVVAALSHGWFERRSTGRNARYGLSARGREKAAELTSERPLDEDAPGPSA